MNEIKWGNSIKEYSSCPYICMHGPCLYDNNTQGLFMDFKRRSTVCFTEWKIYEFYNRYLLCIMSICKVLGIWMYAYMQFLHKMMHWFLSRKYFRDKVSLSLKPTTLNFKSSCNSKMLLRVTENWELNLINLLFLYNTKAACLEEYNF